MTETTNTLAPLLRSVAATLEAFELLSADLARSRAEARAHYQQALENGGQANSLREQLDILQRKASLMEANAAALPQVTVQERLDSPLGMESSERQCWTWLRVGEHHSAVLVCTRMTSGEPAPHGQQIIDALLGMGAARLGIKR